MRCGRRQAESASASAMLVNPSSKRSPPTRVVARRDRASAGRRRRRGYRSHRRLGRRPRVDHTGDVARPRSGDGGVALRRCCGCRLVRFRPDGHRRRSIDRSSARSRSGPDGRGGAAQRACAARGPGTSLPPRWPLTCIGSLRKESPGCTRRAAAARRGRPDRCARNRFTRGDSDGVAMLERTTVAAADRPRRPSLRTSLRAGHRSRRQHDTVAARRCGRCRRLAGVRDDAARHLQHRRTHGVSVYRQGAARARIRPELAGNGAGRRLSLWSQAGSAVCGSTHTAPREQWRELVRSVTDSISPQSGCPTTSRDEARDRALEYAPQRPRPN
jgi:hypothetical protein